MISNKVCYYEILCEPECTFWSCSIIKNEKMKNELCITYFKEKHPEKYQNTVHIKLDVKRIKFAKVIDTISNTIIICAKCENTPTKKFTRMFINEGDMYCYD